MLKQSKKLTMINIVYVIILLFILGVVTTNLILDIKFENRHIKRIESCNELFSVHVNDRTFVKYQVVSCEDLQPVEDIYK